MAITDKFSEVGLPGSATYLAAPGYTMGGTSMNIQTYVGWPSTSKKVIFDVYTTELVGNEEKAKAGTRTTWQAIHNGSGGLSTLQLLNGTDQNYAAGTTTRVVITHNTFWANQLIEGLTTSIADQDGTLKAGAVDVTAVLADSVVTTAKISGGAATTDKMTTTTFAGTMSVAGITTAEQTAASVTLPAVSVAHKYLITANFFPNHAGGAAARDYACVVREGSNLLGTSVFSAAANMFLVSIPISVVFTSSSSGGQTINFRISRNVDNGGSLSSSYAHYTIVDLGRA